VPVAQKRRPHLAVQRRVQRLLLHDQRKDEKGGHQDEQPAQDARTRERRIAGRGGRGRDVFPSSR
jgi:hypothetical protein